MKNELLKTAIEHQKVMKKNKQISDDEIELALAWVKGEISGLAVSKALGCNVTSNIYPFLARALRTYINKQ